VRTDGTGVVFYSSDSSTCFTWNFVGGILPGSGQISILENTSRSLAGGQAVFTGFLPGTELLGAAGDPIRALGIPVLNADTITRFGGQPGQPNCVGKSVSALAQQYGGLSTAAVALGYQSVSDLQNAIQSYCRA
jgi:hypothetical protein